VGIKKETEEATTTQYTEYTLNLQSCHHDHLLNSLLPPSLPSILQPCTYITSLTLLSHLPYLRHPCHYLIIHSLIIASSLSAKGISNFACVSIYVNVPVNVAVYGFIVSCYDFQVVRMISIHVNQKGSGANFVSRVQPSLIQNIAKLHSRKIV